VVLNLHISTKPDHSEPDRVGPNQDLHYKIVVYRQKREHSMTNLNLHNLLFLDLALFLNF